ncbi:Exocyst complex component EXO84A [Hibiscus syriacus]|uniref:Exocyst complex component EXO84A n=1 Tax=Hibiscus syriacus TaxID=106335 RepID=A0A6A2ZA38_HIBSY|nr:exocyst complex component EXO84A-like [Hibiscus syriacus]KAE8688279.1 Exocyst complex component EXO84A [Hibiscus syriacus]
MSIGNLTELESNLTLSDRLKLFKASQFNPDAYLQSKCNNMTEKEIKHACMNLLELRKASAEEMRKSVYANYTAFIRTSKEITVLEGELLSMRNLLSTQAALVHGLAEGVFLDSLTAGTDDSEEDNIFAVKNTKLNKTEKWFVEYEENLEVLLAEKRVDEAMAALEEGEKVAKESNTKQNLSPDALQRLKTALTLLRQKLVDQLAETTCQPFTKGAELRSAVLSIKNLGDGPHAHTLLLNTHQQRLQRGMQSLRPTNNSHGGSTTSALSQLVFSTIAQASSDSLAVFGEEPAYSSELVTWAVKQTDTFALLLKRHALASSAAAGGLRVATECVQICLGHCALLEARGLALSPILMRHFKPCVDLAFSATLKRIEQSTAALAAADDWVLSYAPGDARRLSSTLSFSSANMPQPKLSSSAHKLNSMVKAFMEDVGPLEILQLDGPALEGVLQIFNSYVNLLISALPGSMENEETLDGSGNRILKMAESEAQQLALLANASLLADELLPRAALKLLPLIQASRVDATPRSTSDRQGRVPEQREWKRKLNRSVERLRDSFCRQHALDLIFTVDGDMRLNAEIYISMDSHTEEPEWFPSPIFQELFEKITRMASIAADMFVGRERFATLLLMRQTETVILWLSDDQTFWEEIEQGPTPLGPLGLQQLYLDMEFVMIFASEGRYLSRNLQQVIKTIIERAIEALAATGIDPYSVLPEDDWFAEVAQIAIKMLSGKDNFTTQEGDVTSPTASASAASF